MNKNLISQSCLRYQMKKGIIKKIKKLFLNDRYANCQKEN